MNSTLKILFGGLILVSSINSFSQPYIDGGKTRHRFAQFNLGFESRFISNMGALSHEFDNTGNLIPLSMENNFESRIIIGGTHFWGHADFYVSIPVFSTKNSGYSMGTETGAKFYPWRITNKTIRPYIGSSWLTTLFKSSDGTEMLRFKPTSMLGLTYDYKGWLFNFESGYTFYNKENYFFSSDISAEVAIPRWWFSFGLIKMFDTTLGAEKDWKSGRTERLTDTLATLKRLNGFTIAAGPSSSIFTRKSGYNITESPYLDEHKAVDIFGDFGIGYYLHKSDLQFNLAYRTYRSSLNAFDLEQRLSRKSIAFEVYKFIGDYHGFVPFVGPALSYEFNDIENYESETLVSTGAFRGIKPGITFGWDIRPNRLQSFYLRTNLRYFPNLFVKMENGNKFYLDQLEFNFIQLVIFPGRMF